jgi:tetratricopeptide (TPR) repeat protein
VTTARAPRGLPIVAEGAPTEESRLKKARERQDGAALATAQRHLDEGRLDAALGLLEPLATDPTTPLRANASLLCAGVMLMAGRSADALRVLARLPTDTQAQGLSLDEGYRRMIEACALRRERRYDEALAAAEQSVAQGATTGRLLVLADAQKHAGALEAGARTLERLLASEPGHPTALAQLAGYRYLQGAVEEGARLFAAFEAAVGEETADSLRNTAFVHATRGDVARTIEALRGALALEPAATRGYIADEVELARFHGDERFGALLATL